MRYRVTTPDGNEHCVRTDSYDVVVSTDIAACELRGLQIDRARKVMVRFGWSVEAIEDGVEWVRR